MPRSRHATIITTLTALVCVLALGACDSGTLLGGTAKETPAGEGGPPTIDLVPPVYDPGDGTRPDLDRLTPTPHAPQIPADDPQAPPTSEPPAANPPPASEPSDPPPSEPSDPPPSEPSDPPPASEPADPPSEPADPPSEPADPPSEPADPPSEPVDPPPTSEPPSTTFAAEGEACESATCDSGLACVTIFDSSGQPKAKHCMEQCQSPGTGDPICDGGEVCADSKSAGPVCFNVNNPQEGYTSPGDVPPPPPPPPGVCGDAIESEVFDLVNAERAKAGLPALQCDPIASQVAHAYSQTMCDEGFFSHTGPDGSSAGDRLGAAGATIKGWGENIAKGQQSPADVMEAWMNSSGHRANILRSSFTHIGVGYIPCNGKRYWTQNFLTK